MSEQIVSVAYIENKARRAVDTGVRLSECPYPKSSRAAKTWTDEHIRYSTERLSGDVMGVAITQHCILNARQSVGLSCLNGACD